ncbi:MAG: transcription-repair coupling factor, partial [Leptonema sp. (in: Bacteria)]|nr:transcription-repair coupling factor [Leptonema sp. (in: bacteria)]
ETQRSLENLNQATILPAAEALVDEVGLSKLNKKIESYSSKLRRPDWLLNFNLKNANGRDQAGLEELLPLVQNYISVLDLFESAPVMCLDSDGFALDRAVRVEREYDTLFNREKDSRITVEPDLLINRSILELLNPHIGLVEQKPNNDNIEHENLLRVILHSEHVNLDTGKNNDDSTDSPFIQAPSSFAGKMTEFRKRATSILDENGSLIITSPYTAQIQRIASILKAESIPHETLDWNGPKTKAPKGKILLLQSLRQTGFELPSQSFYIWTDADIFGRSYKKKVNFKKTGSAPIESYLDLHEGDVVVHINHGVGRFVKLERMKAAGRERDFLVLE